ncbi:MAG: hypothetical protein K9K93_03890 [Acholeplasmataceae bacterium]|nr:hypothetical protein [Acholeplasmataceae bacterium]
MSKKIILFAVLAISTLSIMAIAVFGTLPENTNRIRIESLIIDDFDETNADGDKFKDVKNLVDFANNVYVIRYRFEPENASSNIQAFSNNSNIEVQIDTIDHKVYVYFDSQEIGTTVTITVMDADTQASDELTLWFKSPDDVIVPDLD